MFEYIDERMTAGYKICTLAMERESIQYQLDRLPMFSPEARAAASKIAHIEAQIAALQPERERELGRWRAQREWGR